MKKLLIIVSCCFVMAAIFIFGVGLWVKTNIGEITSQLTGMDIQFKDLDFHYSPLPVIVLTDLQLEHGQNTVKVPSVKLYPDIKGIFTGQIQVKRAVLEEPLVLAKDMGRQSSDSRPFSPTAIPVKTFVVNKGSLILTTAKGTTPPLSVTANMEKIDQGISVQVKNMSVNEIGLKFAGVVTVSSFSPLKLKIKATEGSFDPTALKNFLVKFGYLKQDVAVQVPKIRSLECKGIQLTLDTGTGKIHFASKSLSFDKNQLQGVVIDLSKRGYELSFSQGLLDAGSIYSWLIENPKGKEVVDGLLAKAKLKGLSTNGNIRLSSLKIMGSQEAKGDINGSFELKADGLALNIVSQNGEKQNFTISKLEAKITIEKGKPSVRVGCLAFRSSRGGNAKIDGSFALPPDLKEIEFNGSFDSVRIFDTDIDLDVFKKKEKKLTFDLLLSSPSLQLLAKGLLYVPRHKKTDFEAKLSKFRITNIGSQEGISDPKDREQRSKKFDFTLIKDKKVSVKTIVRTFQFNHLPELEDVDVVMQCINDKAILSGTVRLYDVGLVVDAVLTPPSELATQVEAKGVDLDLTSLIACFSKELPVFLTGKVYLYATLSAKGDNPQSLLDTAEGKMTLTLTRCSVYKLSNLDPRLGFLLDIVRVAGINLHKKDTITFNKGVVRASLQKGQLLVNSFSLTGPLVSAWGSGKFTISDKRLRLSGQVQTALGVTKVLDIDRILKKKGT
ncbi:MAG: hypothetical protein GWP10_11815 [Nitrospiraceae bacterium]|nr:hypothetical protein [Nitrospiraceae bacterium]